MHFTLPKPKVAGSNPVYRSSLYIVNYKHVTFCGELIFLPVYTYLKALKNGLFMAIYGYS